MVYGIQESASGLGLAQLPVSDVGASVNAGSDHHRKKPTSRSKCEKWAPAYAGLDRSKTFYLLLAYTHAGTLALVGVDRNQKSIPVGVVEFVSLYVRAVI